MLALKRNQLKVLSASRKVELCWDALLKDLILLLSLWLARFLVWQTIRRERKEHEFRRKRLQLVERSKC
jgi:hypothetical protein